MQVGTTKDQGLYNKPSAAAHPEALAAGTLLKYNIPAVEQIANPYVEQWTKTVMWRKS